MNKQFTASEVREVVSHMDDVAMTDAEEILLAFASRLEADEKAGEVRKDDFAAVAQWKEWMAEGERMYLEQECSPSHLPCFQESINFSIAYALRKLPAAHAPAQPAVDVEELVESSRGQFERWARKRHSAGITRWEDTGKYILDNTGARWECWKEAIAACFVHSAQAQPPAASVTDAMAVFEVVSGVEGPCLTISRKDGGKPRHEYRLAGPKPWGGGNTTHSFKVHTRELREQIDDIEAALAAQENPNG